MVFHFNAKKVALTYSQANLLTKEKILETARRSAYPGIC